ncbi:hypothetical protein L228DRAFT_270175 [Xylona heveae TC161]|uniref:TRIP4/RQT4 C2HC5-type zinc finger domain-containing protein n=1 Tax=Xylona heveae (strain CBS 132557 / TC161) TaxID=1328760 RepID=A0A165FFC2_XYLHT|nr:hypothetical protein L228DRAFT_270175 [Xylona heveae TC161]KZF20910.1 hypothetical protein L228DRAFT_270175 [Xylona heveae TC161]
MSLTAWALPRLANIIPLDEDSLKQILDYACQLPKDAAATHLKDLLGDSPQSLEFITSFNSRREAPQASQSSAAAAAAAAAQDAAAASEVPRAPRRSKKQKQPLNKLPPPRQANEGTAYANASSPSGAYIKRDVEDYMSGAARRKDASPSQSTNAFALSDTPEARQLPVPSASRTPATSSPSTSAHPSPKLPPSAAGPLISSTKSSRSSSPAKSNAKAKIAISGGTSMKGQSTTINDLDSAIRTLEIQTNPTLSREDNARRRCNCNAHRHPLLAAAPNCLNCGKIICVKEGIGPCTFCSAPLLSPDEIQSMVRILREERGHEKMEANNALHRRADVSTTPRPFSGVNSTEAEKKLAAAKQHRDKLLSFQAQNARRTHIIDEAADFETPSAGQNMWASPQERALQLKRQQHVLRELQWNAKPEYEKRRVVVSVDLVGGKIVKRMGEIERPEDPLSDLSDSEQEDEEDDDYTFITANDSSSSSAQRPSGGAFGRNPLLGSVIRPVYKPAKEKGKLTEPSGAGSDAANGSSEANEDQENHPRKSIWRRVQDDKDDNEEVILDGGVYGGRYANPTLGEEEHAYG